MSGKIPDKNRMNIGINTILVKHLHRNMTQPELGKKIADLRKQKGLTQEELVEKCNVNVRTLQRIESGEVNPRRYTVKLIFEALDYDINQIYAFHSNEAVANTLTYIHGTLTRIYHTMKNSKTFFYHFFLAIGVVWFLCALAILSFKLNFQSQEILLTIIIPLAYAIIRLLDKGKVVKVD